MPVEPTKPKVLICHPWMGLAGSELVTIWLLQALRGKYDLFLCTAEGVDIAKWNAAAGTTLKVGDFKWVRAPKLFESASSSMLPHLHRARFEQFCRSIAPGFDLLISSYNPIAFGRPAMHIIGDLRWRQQFICSEDDWALIRQSGALTSRLHKVYRSLVNRLLFRTKNSDFNSDDLFVSNSLWTQKRYLEWAPQVRHELLYPPVPVDTVKVLHQREAGSTVKVVSLGRVSAEKRIEQQIEIIDQLRELGHDVQFTIIGSYGSEAYAHSIQSLVESRPWIKLAGALYGEKKAAILDAAGFALHTCEIEAFGIAAAEMAYAGCLTMVPAGSGTAEVVTESKLHFSSTEEAVKKLDHLLKMPASELHALRVNCRRHVEQSFLPPVFVKSACDLVADFYSSRVIKQAAVEV